MIGDNMGCSEIYAYFRVMAEINTEHQIVVKGKHELYCSSVDNKYLITQNDGMSRI